MAKSAMPLAVGRHRPTYSISNEGATYSISNEGATYSISNECATYSISNECSGSDHTVVFETSAPHICLCLRMHHIFGFD
jgi:hypothetical protein